MIGMGFTSFLVLLVISVVVSLVLHFGLDYYIRTGWDSIASKVIVGWLGAWLGSPVFGHWFETLHYEDIYYVPAALGSLSLLVLVIDVVQSCRA